MPLERPGLARIDADIQADIRSGLAGTEPALKRSFLGAIGRALAGAVHGLYGYLAWTSRQIFATSADEANLLLQAAEWGIERIPAAAAGGTITISGEDGSAVNRGTIWQGATRQQYRQAATVAVAGGSATAAVEAVEAGAAGNAAAGAALTPLAPIAGVTGAVAADGLTGGADLEGVEALRSRLLFRKRNPVRGGGTDPDYVRWARAAGVFVSAAWCFPLGANPDSTPAQAGVLGTVKVFFMAAANEPAPATGTIAVTGTNGAAIAAGTVFQDANNNKFRTKAAAAIGASGVDIAATAVREGEAGNIPAATALTLVVADANVTGAAASGAFSGGADKGIPTADQVAQVAAYIGARRPVTADVTVAAPSPVPLDLTIDTLTPDTAAVRAAIEAEIADLVVREAKPGGAIPISQITEAISSAEGETDHQLTAPAGTGIPPRVTHAADEIAVAGLITWS